MNRGDARRNKGDVDEAIADYATAIGLDSDPAKAYMMRAWRMTRKGIGTRRSQTTTWHWSGSESLFRAFNNLGASYQKKGDLEAQSPTLMKRSDLTHDCPPYVNRASAKEDKGDIQGAIADCTKAIAYDPKCLNAYYVRGTVYDRAGKTQKQTWT